MGSLPLLPRHILRTEANQGHTHCFMHPHLAPAGVRAHLTWWLYDPTSLVRSRPPQGTPPSTTTSRPGGTSPLLVAPLVGVRSSATTPCSSSGPLCPDPTCSLLAPTSRVPLGNGGAHSPGRFCVFVVPALGLCLVLLATLPLDYASHLVFWTCAERLCRLAYGICREQR
jgi:hypothetical protein